MTYRSVFVHVDDAEPCERRMEIAARLARTYPAQLLGAYLVPSGNVTPFTSAMLPDEVVQRRLRESTDLQRGAEARFGAAAARAAVTSVEWHAPSGNPLEAAVLHARYADLAVIGQPSRDEPNAAFATELANAVVMGSGRPVLFVPYVGQFKTVGERVMIAWKDSRESARAVADALPLLKDAKKVFAVAVTPDADDSLRDLLADKQVAAFLRRHEVDATVRRIVAPDIDAGELLLSQAADFGADLIVMGAYSRPRITALVWGGVTRVMLSSMTVPVLMSH
jgi:nucleotide-binding universal stress UspA family protein